MSLSVVMPAYNALPHLDASMESVLGQSHPDFELVIRDDASTDGTAAALRDWALRDERVKLTEGDVRLGPAGNSDWVVRAARGRVIARADADDLLHPDRLRRQLAVLDAEASVDAVGSLWEIIDEAGRFRRPPDRWRMARPSAFAPFAHSTLMFRRTAFDRIGGYRPACEYWEDVDLYLRLAAQGRIAVIPEPLVQVRHTMTTTRIGEAARAYDRMFRCVEAWERDGDYEHLLDGAAVGRLAPEALVALGAIELWGGGRPRILRPLRRSGRLGLDRRTLAALVWGAWAQASPGSLRLALRALHRARDLATGRRILPDAVYEWVPGARPRVLWRT